MLDIIKIGFQISPLEPIQIWLVMIVLAVAIYAIYIIAMRGRLLLPKSLRKDWLKLLIISFFVPAFFEEIIFRALWFAPNRNSAETLVWLVASTCLFVVWHFVQGKTFHKQYNEVFLSPHFLICTAILGASCYLLLAISGSLWPSIIFHWLLVFVWQLRYGGVVLGKK